MCVTDHHDMTLAVKVALNTNTTNQPTLVVLFNKILDSGTFPETWSDTLILPIYKSGSRNDPNNYRGITLLNIMYKIFSNIINECLITWTQTFHILDEAQAGFRKGYSAIDNIFTLQSMVKKYLSKPGVDSMYYIYRLPESF